MIPMEMKCAVDGRQVPGVWLRYIEVRVHMTYQEEHSASTKGINWHAGDFGIVRLGE